MKKLLALSILVLIVSATPVLAQTLYYQSQFFCEVGVSGYCVNINSNQTGRGNVTLQVTSKNREDSAMYITSTAKDRGGLKVTLDNPSGEPNGSAAALSVVTKGETTSAQGIFIDCGKSTGSAVTVMADKPEGRKKLFSIDCEGNLHIRVGAKIINDLN